MNKAETKIHAEPW